MLKQIQPKNICIVRLSAIGDVCHALAVARSIQKNSPEINITWIIGKTEADLISDIADIEFIIFDKTKGIRGVWFVRSSCTRDLTTSKSVKNSKSYPQKTEEWLLNS